MEVISFTNKKFDNLKPYELDKTIINTEAKFYSFTHQRKEKLLKLLYHQNGEIFANKLYTLEMLDIYKKYLPNYFCIPESLVTVGGVVKGFSIPKLEGTTLSLALNNKDVSIDKKILYLKKVGGILEHLNSIRKNKEVDNIYLNDLHDGNFIVNLQNDNIYVIDLDSCRIKNNGPYPAKYFTPKTLSYNLKNKYKMDDKDQLYGDENSDLYCYIIMILNFLYNGDISTMKQEEFYNYLTYLDSLKVNKDLLDIFNLILTTGDNKNPFHYLDTLSYKQIFYAKNDYYKLKIKK